MGVKRETTPKVDDLGTAPAELAAPPIPDRRERGRRRRRDQVYEAAMALFVEQGFDNTTMDEIADRADVARATVFNLFQRKSALLDEWAARRRERAMSAITAEHLENHSLREILARYMIELGTLSTASRQETVLLMSACVHSTNILGRPELGTEFGRFVSRAIDAGQLCESIDPSRVGRVLAGAYFAVLTGWIDVEPAPFDLTEELLGVLDLILDGILPRRR